MNKDMKLALQWSAVVGAILLVFVVTLMLIVQWGSSDSFDGQNEYQMCLDAGGSFDQDGSMDFECIIRSN